VSASAEAIADAAFALVEAALAAGPIPGAVLGVVTRAGARATRFAGAAQVVPTRENMRAETWFDLASLTKPIFTTSAILRLGVDLDAPLVTVIPDLRQYDMAAPERRLTFRQCLTHQTHLPAVEPLYTYGLDPPTIRAFVLQRVWRAGPPVYSDINFLLLGIAIERLTGVPLHEAALPPGLSFRPDAALCAATEKCTWRGRVMRGEVHDENAFSFHGAGHAGLFGTADGVLNFALSLLGGEGWAEAGLTAIRTRATPTRTVGWEAAHPGWSGGEMCSPSTIGHTGFTGTGLWLDFERGLAWTLLTNRVHPSRHVDSGIFTLRRAVGDAVAAASAG
jgi:CubicO group peptidase (beta-lactamase class C family)